MMMCVFVCVSTCHQTCSSLSCRQKASEWSSDEETKELNVAAPSMKPTERVQSEGAATCHSYRKSLRLSSDQIVSSPV